MDENVDLLKKDGFYANWARMLRRRSGPATLAQLMLHKMSLDDDKARMPYVWFVNFIDSRTWAEVKKEIYPALLEEEREAFESKRAGSFFSRFRRMVVTAVMNYYEGLEPKLREEVGDLADARLLRISGKFEALIREEIGKQMKALAADIQKRIMESFRKECGEQWKGEYDLGTDGWSKDPEESP